MCYIKSIEKIREERKKKRKGKKMVIIITKKGEEIESSRGTIREALWEKHLTRHQVSYIIKDGNLCYWDMYDDCWMRNNVVQKSDTLGREEVKIPGKINSLPVGKKIAGIYNGETFSIIDNKAYIKILTDAGEILLAIGRKFILCVTDAYSLKKGEVKVDITGEVHDGKKVIRMGFSPLKDGGIVPRYSCFPKLQEISYYL